MKKQDKDEASIINQNKKFLETQKKNVTEIKDELNTEKKNDNTTSNATGSKIAKLQETSKYYAQKIETEKKRLSELQEKIDEAESKLEKRRGDLRNDGKGSMGLLKEIKSLEHQLEKSLQRHNEAIAQNKNLREEINALRRERVIFDNIYTQLESELGEKKKELEEVDKAKKATKEARDQALSKLAAIKSKAVKDQKNFEKEYQKVFQYLDQENREEKKREKFPSRDNLRGDGDMEEMNVVPDKSPPRAENKALDDPSKRAKEKKVNKDPAQNVKNLKAEVEEYEKIIQRLQKETTVDDVDKIVELFMSYNEKNYSLYKLVNELSDEIEKLEKQIQEVNLEKAKYDTKEEDTDPKAKLVRELKTKLEITEKKQDNVNKQHEEIMKTVNSLKVGIPIIFERIGCNTEEYLKDLLPNQGINEGNILQYLAIIEQRTNEILQMYEECQEKEGKKGKKEDEPPTNMVKTQAVETRDMGALTDYLTQMKEKISTEDNTYFNGDELEDKAKKHLKDIPENRRARANKP